MFTNQQQISPTPWRSVVLKGAIVTVLFCLCGFNVFSNNVSADDEPLTAVGEPAEMTDDRHRFSPDDAVIDNDEARRQYEADFITVDLDTVAAADPYGWVERKIAFNPSPTKAVWLSALFPGLGQVYNRRYWKLPLIAGGYLGLAYATSWNNTMLSDYTVAYADLMDSDPTTRSYMDFFPPSVSEDSLDKQWLQNILQSRKNYFRRNRDLCIICMVGVYLLAMVDAYVDASLSHFDISPDLSMDVAPALMSDGRNRLPSIGLQWAINF